MTKFPTESRNVVGLSGERYEMPQTCARPGCVSRTDHAHHLFSRGLMGGAYNFVRLDDGTETGNLLPLCFKHHEQITNNQCAIVWREGKFWWADDAMLAPLRWQPPLVGQVPAEPVHEGDAGTEHYKGRQVCTGCGRALPRLKQPETQADEGKKIRKTWAVSVPHTAEEDGAETLDALLEAAREEMDRFGLDWGDGHKVKFYILSTALGLFVQHSESILNDA